MKRLFILVTLLLSMGFAEIASAQYTNPVIDFSVPDPSIIKAQDGYFYLVGTEDVHNVPILRSRNLVDWTKTGTAFTDQTRPSWLTDGAVWAPDINYINGQYVMYYSLSKWGEGTNNGIGVAVANRPEGPYSAPSGNTSGKLFTSSEIGVNNSIDPFFIADGGKNYLFWGSFNGIYCIELSADGLSVKSGASKTKVINNTVEASSIIKHDGYYYFIGSAGSCCEGASSTYKLVMARSTSLTSGYKNKSGQAVQNDGVLGIGKYNLTDLLTKNSEVIGPGHCSEIVQDDQGKYWFVYHGYDATDVDAGRQVFLSEVKWGNDGWPYIEGGSPAINNTTAPDLPAVHEISTAQQLVDYANMVNSGNGHVDAVLTADIDMTGINDFPGIGNDASNLNRFHATFDGRGHRIKNLHMQGDCVALFPVASDNTVIKNLIIDASCSFTGTGRNAAFVSACNWDEWGSKKVEFYNCGNEAEVIGTEKNCGAFLGCNYDGDIAIIMKNCYNTGHIKGSSESAALSGWIGNQGANRIDHCYNTGEVEGLDGNNTNNLFRGSVGEWVAPNNYCFDTHYSYNTGSVFDASKVGSGELCFLLNQGQPEMQWYQTLGTDSHPIPVSSSQPVYCTGNLLCDGTTTGTVTFSNTEGADYSPHQFAADDDICDRCGKGRKPQQVDGVYQISSIGNLVWFSEAVNSGFGVNYKAALTTDISQGRAVYTPIGTPAYPYRGQFDGQTHSVTLQLDNGGYDYQGIFGVITDGVCIRNLVARGSITGKSYVGGIAGGTNGGSNNAQKTTLENCGNEATVTATGVNAGAMIGVNMGGSASFIFRNCYNVGAINGPDVGAFSGWSGGGWSQFYNCYNAGKVNGGGDADFSRNNGTGFNNCYYVAGCNNNSRDATGQLESVNAAQLAYGGNLLGKLNTNGTFWYQDKYDAYPLPFGHPLEVELNEESTVMPTSYTSVDVTVIRGINAGTWSTIVLPFAIADVQSVFGNDVVVKDFTGYDYNATTDHITVNFSDVTAMEANHPYIIKVGSPIEQFTVENVDVTPSKDPRVQRGTTDKMKDFAGTYVANFNFYEAATNTPLYISGNQFWYASAQTKPMKAFRAYFDFADDHVQSSRIQMSFDETTGINEMVNRTREAIGSSKKSVNGKYYDLQGRQIDNRKSENRKLTKGLYIVNGKKVVIK